MESNVNSAFLVYQIAMKFDNKVNLLIL